MPLDPAVLQSLNSKETWNLVTDAIVEIPLAEGSCQTV